MSRYCLKSKEIIGIKKLLKKWGTFGIDNGRVCGEVTINSVRQYTWGFETDVVINGKVFFNYKSKQEYYTSEMCCFPNVSKIKINRIIRKSIHKEVNMRLKYFGIHLPNHELIKKIKWI